MESVWAIILALCLSGYGIGSARVINQGNQAIVERLGKYKKTLPPGLKFVWFPLENIAVEETTREQVLDIEPQQAITKDNISAEVDAVVYWRINNLYKAYYDVEDVKEAITNLVITTLRSEIGRMDLDETYSSRSEINENLSIYLKEAADSWGAEVIRVELQEIKPPQTVLESLEQERAAESKKKAAIYEAEGERESAIARAEGTVKSLEMISKALLEKPNSQDVLKYLIATRYVEANEKLGESSNSKIVFMDPKALTEAMTDLMETPELHIKKDGGNGSN
ncbi:MAG: stomatin-like protein [Coleofasciculus sp. C1-SOL-03]|jgi:regulator of protease activity HflC (stomatin/prohibitin superfamily)|uniref:SPFH domain-containing protein n=1 Tax=Coleofasciculus sp. C1-SOL-03 TaxID=3069522 RepID=UPI003301DFA9